MSGKMNLSKTSSDSTSCSFFVKITAVFFLLIPILFFTKTKDPFIIKETAAQTLLLFAVLYRIILIVEKRTAVQKPILLLPLTLFLISILISLKNAAHSMLVFNFFFWQILLVLFYWISTRIQSFKEKDFIFKSIAAASLVSGIYGMMQHYGFDFISWSIQWDSRPGSTFGNPNFAAGWWIMTIPIFGIKFLTRNNRFKWFWFGLTLLTAMNLYWGRTRGAWIAILLALIFSYGLRMLFKWTRNSEKIIFHVIHLFIVAIFFSALFYWGKVQMNRPQDSSVRERIFKWKTALRMIKEHPFFGVGAENLKVYFALYQAEVRQEMKLQMNATSESNVHNEFFQIWAELGTFGLAAFLLIFILWYSQILQNRHQLLKEDFLEKWGEISAVFAFLLFCLTNFPFHIVPNASLLFFLLASTEMTQNNVENPIKKTQPEKSNLYIRSGAVIVFTLIFFKWIFFPFYAERLRFQAGEFKNQKDYEKAIELYQKAIRLDFYASERTAYELGECFRAIGDYSNAIKSYEISTQLRNYGEVYNNIGNCYYLLNQQKEAVENWEKAVQLELPDPRIQIEVQNNLKILKEKLNL